jgi:hypothetical protein
LLGWTADDLARAVSRGRLLRLRRGVYVSTRHLEEWTSLQRADVDLARRGIAAALTSPSVLVSHLASAQLKGLPVWAPKARGCSTVDDNRTRVPGLHVHRTPVGDHASTVAGYRVTDAVRTVLDIACEFGTEAGLVVADAALAAGMIDVDELKVAVELGAGRTGIASARPLPAFADGRAESPLESRSRWKCHEFGLPAPIPQVLIYDLDGTFLGRVDLYWEAGVIGEVDGAAKMADQGARRALLERQSALTRTHLRLVRWGTPALHDFGPTADWLWRELATASTDPRPRLWRAVAT